MNTPEKLNFIDDEIMMLTINASFQRANIYNESINESVKGELKNRIKSTLKKLSQNYHKPIDESKHIRNIEHLAEEMNLAIRSDCRRIGIAQKLLNLYLKYLWCLNIIPQPPHCPFDSIILAKLYKKIPSWTKCVDINEYTRWVAEAKIAAKDSSIAEWELNLYTKFRIS